MSAPLTEISPERQIRGARPKRTTMVSMSVGRGSGDGAPQIVKLWVPHHQQLRHHQAIG